MKPTRSKNPARDPFTPRILAWFRRHRRDLPWRILSPSATRSPYRVWVSEIMLQQTTVSTVIPRFERWMKRFPDIASLAAASESDVLCEWEGLGYYTRARNLRLAAHAILERHDGVLPGTYNALRKLPGIGDYTACAVLSLAYGKPHAVLDANVKRVVARVLALRTWNSAMEEKSRAWLEVHLSRRAPGAFNEAMMELGALVCVSGDPRCPECPVASFCRGRALGIAAQIPSKKPRTVTRKRSDLFLILWKGRVAILPADRTRFLQGLWVFPRRDEIRVDGARKKLSSVVHAYMKTRERLCPLVVEPARKPVLPHTVRWVRLADLGDYPMASAYRRIADQLRAERGRPPLPPTSGRTG